MHRRTLLAGMGAAALMAACTPPQQQDPATPADGGARAITDPAAVVRQLYEPYLTEGATLPPFREQAPWSNALWAQLEAMVARSQVSGEPILDFDPLIDAQDYELSNIQVTTDGLVEASHAVVRASFTNLGEQNEVIYDLVWEDDRWKVDNIRTASWDLRQIAAS
jgi:hypothetical protein